MTDTPCCRECWMWAPEPWDMSPVQEDAFCVELGRRTEAAYLCEHYLNANEPLGPWYKAEVNPE